MSLGEGQLLICFGLLLAAALFPRLCLSAGEWSYDDHHGDGPSNWKKSFPDCGKSKQSPIDIRKSVSEYKDMEQLEFTGYNEVPPTKNSYTLINNGHTVELSVASGNMRIRKGALPGEYKLYQFHVHWGNTNSKGSEHTVNGRSYPLEIHFVHYNDKYTNFSEAVPNTDGLAVVGVFAKVGDESHPVLEKLIEKFSSVKYKDSDTTIDSAFQMIDLLPPNRDSFFRYPGSLTTPRCQESVVWTVLKKPIIISQTQLNAFRALGHYPRGYKKDAPLVDNFRPVQPLGDRILLRNCELDDDDDSPEQAASSSFTDTGALICPTPSVSLMALVAAMLARSFIR